MPGHDEVLTDRPDFMKALGLLPPYSVADVENAYVEQVRLLQIDSDPDEQTRHELRAAYESALDFARFRESRRNWIGGHIDSYVARQATIERITELGGSYVLQEASRYLWSYGEDFAEIMCKLVQVDLTGPQISNSALDCLGDEQLASEVMVLVLRDSQITDAGIGSISHLQKLRCLDLRNTSISNKSFEPLCSFPHLRWLQLHGTKMGFWTLRRLRRRNPGLEIAANELAAPPPVYEAAYEHAHLMERIAGLPARRKR